MVRRRVLGALFCVALAGFGLAGCSGSKGTQESKEEPLGEKVVETTVGGCPITLWENGTLEFTCSEMVIHSGGGLQYSSDDLRYRMEEIKRIKSGPIKVSGTLREFFKSAHNLSDISDLKNWDVSDVTSMDSMLGYTSISNVDALANWDTSKVENMREMFADTKITSVDALANWDTSNVEVMFWMFSGTGVKSPDDLPKKWDLSNLDHSTEQMFSDE